MSVGGGLRGRGARAVDRLYESTSYGPTPALDRILTFSDTPFQGILAPRGTDGTSPDYNSGGGCIEASGFPA